MFKYVYYLSMKLLEDTILKLFTLKKKEFF